MTKQDTTIDCIIIGYHDLDFASVLAEANVTKTFSGTYWSMMAASVDYMGERLSYEVLLNKYLTQQHGRESNLHVSRVPNLGVCYLYSYLKKRHCQVAYVNFFTEEQQHLAALLQRNPKSVAITTTYYTRHSPIVEIVQFIKRHNPKTKIIVGGPHIYKLCSYQNEKRQDEAFHDMGADIYINDSQGELTLSRVVHALTQTPPSDFRSIPNLIVSDGTPFHRTGLEVEQNSLDNDVVDWRYFDRTFIAPIVPMRTARSCAYKCAFCDFPTLAGPLNLTSLDVVEQELRQLSEAGVTRILFVDDTFNVPLPRFKQLCRLMIDKKFDFEWFSYFRCSNADDEVFGLMRDSGCRGVLLGVESGDQTVLNHMNKKVKVDHYRKGIHQLKAHDIITYASFIIGFPGETRETALNTLRFIEETAPTFYTLNLYYYDKKTPIHQKAGDYDLRGNGYSWKHRSMEWREACGLMKMMHQTITQSVYLPSDALGFWAIPYLMSQGISVEQTKQFLEFAKDLLLKELPVPAELHERPIVPEAMHVESLPVKETVLQ